MQQAEYYEADHDVLADSSRCFIIAVIEKVSSEEAEYEPEQYYRVQDADQATDQPAQAIDSFQASLHLLIERFEIYCRLFHHLNNSATWTFCFSLSGISISSCCS